MTKNSDKKHKKRDSESKQDARNNFWYSMALLAGNIGIIVKILIGFMTERKK